MMNNPAPPMYASQSPGPYAFNNPQAAGLFSMSPGPPFDNAQAPFQPGMIPNHMQRPSHPQQPQQLQQPIPQPFFQQHPGQVGGFSRPEHFSPQDKVARPSSGPSPNPANQMSNQMFNTSQSQTPNPSPHALPVSSAAGDMNLAANMNMPLQGPSHASLAQQAQMQNAAQMARVPHAPPLQQQPQQQQPQQQPQPQQQQQQQHAGGGPLLSPQSSSRERARVSVLLEINTLLLQEVVSLQVQGKAGTTLNPAQQSPTSPTSATDPTSALNNSPGEPPKPSGGSSTTASKPPSQEYADCMRRLQANLSYLAAIADAKKKVNGALPSGPAIMVAPPNIPQVQDLYRKLNALFPEAGQSAVSKAVAYAGAQNQSPNPGANPQQPTPVSAQG